MSESDSTTEQFLIAFENGDVRAASQQLAALSIRPTLKAHPLLVEAVERNAGHCYQKNQLAIATMLMHPNVLVFKTVLKADDAVGCQKMLDNRPELASADLIASRGIGRPIHHWHSIEVAELLIRLGADINDKNSLGETPLAMQARFGTTRGMEFLLSHGVDPNDSGVFHLPSPVMNERISLLQKHGWDIDRSPLLHDANHGHGKRVQTWLKFGANPNVVDDEGQTALHYFADRGTGLEAVKALLHAGADSSKLDHQGRSPIDLSRQKPDSTVARFLLEKHLFS